MDLADNFNSSSSYRFNRQLGTGGSADVYLYTRQTDGLPDQKVVLKVFKNKDSDAVTELINEGRRLTEIKHPNILTTYGYEKINESTYALLLEFIEGRNLREILPSLKMKSRGTAASYIIRCVAEALLATHAQRIIHGDLSSRNILISKAGQVKLSDFGQSRSLGQSLLKNHKGSIDYLAPERWTGLPSSREGDLFALGILAFEILAGENYLRRRKQKLFFKTQPWLDFNEWQKFFDLTLAEDPSKRGTIDEILNVIPQSVNGQSEITKYIDVNEESMDESHYQSTMTIFLRKGPWFLAIQRFYLKLLLVLFLLINSVAIGDDHSISSERFRPSLLTVTSSPWGEVFIDGLSLGYTPILNATIKTGLHKFIWQNREGLRVRRTIMNYGNGIFAYKIINNKGRPVKVAPLMQEDY